MWFQCRHSRPYVFVSQAPAGASPAAAVAAAARDVLVSVIGQLPLEITPPACIAAGIASVQADYTAALAASPAAQAKVDGIAVGQAAAAFLDPGLVPLTGNIEVPTLVSFGKADITFGINFVDEGREIFTGLDTRAVGEKYRVEIQRGVHQGFTDICAFLAGNLEAIQQGNASPLDPINLLAFLTFDGQIPPSPPAAVGKSRDGPQAICSPALFYRPDNFAVWNAVTLLPPAPPIPLSAFLFPPDLIPGYIDANSAYTPSLASSKHLQIVNTEVVAFFNKHLQGDKRYHRYLLPSYAHAKKLAAEVEYCKATPGNAEVCFDKHGAE